MSLFSIASDSDSTRSDTTPIKREPPRPPQQAVTPDERPTSRPAQRAVALTLTPDQTKVLKTRGLVGFKGRGKPPVDIWVDNPKTKKKSMLCSNFSTVGYYCHFGDACEFFHCRSLRDLSEGPRAAYKAFVEQSDQLAFCIVREGQ
jgi:hypothetical protein